MNILHPKLARYATAASAIWLLMFLAFAASTIKAAPVRVAVKWFRTVRVSVSTPTLQVVVNPLLRPGLPISHRAFQALHRLKANDVRFVPWLPYPQLAVAELKPPAILYAAINGTFSKVWNRGAISVLMVSRWVVGSSSRHRSMV